MNIEKILIVDDSFVSRKIIMQSLPSKYQECTIIQGSNGEEAISLYQEHSPDIVLMDITMPILDGIQALIAIRKYDTKACIVMISADIQQRRKEEADNNGAYAMLDKPVNPLEVSALFYRLSNE